MCDGYLYFPPTQNELAHYIDAQVSEAQTKKTLASLKNKVHGLAVRSPPPTHTLLTHTLTGPGLPLT